MYDDLLCRIHSILREVDDNIWEDLAEDGEQQDLVSMRRARMMANAKDTTATNTVRGYDLGAETVNGDEDDNMPALN